MNPVALVRRFPLVSFLLLACLFGWSPYLITFLTGGSGAENFPLGPILATLVVVSCQGREELRGWASQIRSWRAAPKWYASPCSSPITLQVLIVFANHGLSAAPLPTSVPSSLTGPRRWSSSSSMLMLHRHRRGDRLDGVRGTHPATTPRPPAGPWTLSAAMRIFWHLPLMLSRRSAPWCWASCGNAAFTMVTLQLLVIHGRLVARRRVARDAQRDRLTRSSSPWSVGEDHSRLSLLMSAEYAAVAVLAYLVGRQHPALPETPNGVDSQRPINGGTHVD